jgi:hypothetical protein
MTVPVVHYGNLLASGGTLSGTESTDDNQVDRVADGSINLLYQAVSGLTDAGTVTNTLDAAFQADSLSICDATGLSGYIVTVESEDVGGGNNVVHLTTSAQSNQVLEVLTGVTTDRRVWRVTFSGAAATELAKVAEVQLGQRQAFPRSPSLGVTRTRMRQFNRTEIPGGQPFVLRMGPLLRQSVYTFVAVSGSEVSGLETFVEAIDGGDMFTLEDDLGQSYCAELLGRAVDFADSAGIYTQSWTFREVKVD